MSGGFFRGTSADQDTRFSNKQAKLLKTQKFAPELDHLVDMTKVKMDVMKPWIARRVTELLGFEDEVLINFVYGLLDAKEVDGKQIQIQLTGFMEKNTGKFMRELWGLLLSAQKNASGVPQQFLDEKEEEMRKKKVESDRITQEIQKKKDREGLEPDYAKQKRMDGEADITRHVDAASDDGPKNSVWKDSSANLEEEREIDGRHGSRRTSRHHSTSPRSDNQSPPLQRSAHAKSRSRSFSNSRSYSEDGHKSRSVSVSASPPRRSTSQDQRRRSLAKYSVSPNQRRSPQITRSSSRQKSPYLGRPSSRSLRRSPSPVRRRSPSPVRRRSPSPSPVRRRSPSPVRRRSPPPVRRRSPSPVRRRSPSPVRRRSPSPVFRRSPIRVRRRSPSSPFRHSPPLRRRSPTSLRRRSPAPHRRSPSPPRRRSPARPRYQSPQRRYRRSPLPSWHRSPLRRRSPVKLRRRSPSPAREISPQQRSQSPVRRRSPSPFRRSPLPRSPARQRKSSLHYAVDLRSSPRQRNRMQTSQRSRSPQNHGSLSMEHANHGDGVEIERNRRSPVHSLKRDENENADFGRSRVDSPSEQWQHVRSETNAKKPHSFSYERDTNKSGNSRSLSRSPARQSRGRKDLYNSLEASRENPDAREGSYKKTHSSSKRSPYSPTRASGKLSGRTNSGEFSPERVVVKESLNVRGNQVDVKLKEHHEQRRNVEHSGSRVQQVSQLSEDVEYGPGKVDENFLPDGLDNKRSSRKRQGSSSPDERPRNENHHLKNSYSKEASRTDEKKRLHIEDKSNYAKKSRKQLDESHQVAPADTDSEEDEINRSHGNEKISKKSEINEATSEDYDSALDHRKETKRRRKEERRMRKEEKRRRRDEKHRRREERRAQKKSKYVDTVTPPPDYERNNGVANNSDEDAGLRVSKTSDMKETESEQKQLEIDLRIKALESLRAKKAISH